LVNSPYANSASVPKVFARAASRTASIPLALAGRVDTQDDRLLEVAFGPAYGVATL
jgi:hypothetical protein